ncbi:hypothetical protein EJ04DRAFT_418579, partial [Polyplosphaeria fusca]
SCEACGRAKPSRHGRYGKLFPLPRPVRSWTDITMDFIVDLPWSQSDSKWYNAILVVVDQFT